MFSKMQRRVAAVTLLGALLLSGPAHAHSEIDGIEHIFGATAINAVTGHGRLSVGVSAEGDLTVLSWPNPSLADQLAYLSSNAFDARDLPRFGAPEGAGLFLGLLIENPQAQRQVTWLRDREVWSIEQSYTTVASPNVETRYNAADLGLTVTITDAVAPLEDDADVLVRQVDIVRNDLGPVRAAWLLTYANLSPTPVNSKIAEIPVVDWLFDGSNDFAALWDPDVPGVMHFHPNDQLVFRQPTDLLFPPRVNYGRLGELLQAGTPSANEIAEASAALDTLYSPGSYVLLTTRPAPDEHQVGYDATPMCAARDVIADNILSLAEMFPDADLLLSPEIVDVFRCRDEPPTPERQGWSHVAADALLDAADGQLEGSDIAAGEVNEALRTPLTFSPLTDGGFSRSSAAVILGFARTASSARAAVQAVRAPETVLEDAETALASWLETVNLPDASEAVRDVARRSLINLRVGTDAATGTIVASISRQPPYYVDWPRDGAFFNVALDVAGQSDLVTQRAGLWTAWQRQRPVPPVPLIDQPPPRDPTTGSTATYPADSWEMNYFPDGTPGGPIRFEIDNTAFALWSMVAHAGWVEDPSAYLREHWSTIARAGRLLARWVDPTTGLQAPASEDDNTAYTQELQGAVTVFGALDVASRAARLLGETAQAERWEQRACELRGAIETLMYDGEARRFVNRPNETFDPARAPTGRTAWLVWPMRVLPWEDPRIDEQLLGDLELIERRIRLEAAGGSYFMKNTVTFGLTLGTNPKLRPELVDLENLLATQHATSDTHHFGEVMLVEPGPVVSQRTATPHLWEGILFYLTAMAMDDPARFDRHDVVLPPSQVPESGTTCVASAACAGDCNRDDAVTVDEVITGVATALGVSPLAACPAFDQGYDGAVTVDEIVVGVERALTGCPDLPESGA